MTSMIYALLCYTVLTYLRVIVKILQDFFLSFFSARKKSTLKLCCLKLYFDWSYRVLWLELQISVGHSHHIFGIQICLLYDIPTVQWHGPEIWGESTISTCMTFLCTHCILVCYILAATAQSLWTVIWICKRKENRLFTPNSFNTIGSTEEAHSSPMPTGAPCLGDSMTTHSQ